MHSTRFARRAIVGLAALLFLTPASVAAADIVRPSLASEIWHRTELYFGTLKPDSTAVTDAQFKEFIDAVVTPLFPDGLTRLKGKGQFKNSAQLIIKEDSWVVILFYPAQQTDASKNIEAIRKAYRDKHQQESVLRVDSFSLVSF